MNVFAIPVDCEERRKQVVNYLYYKKLLDQNIEPYLPELFEKWGDKQGNPCPWYLFHINSWLSLVELMEGPPNPNEINEANRYYEIYLSDDC